MALFFPLGRGFFAPFPRIGNGGVRKGKPDMRAFRGLSTGDGKGILRPAAFLSRLLKKKCFLARETLPTGKGKQSL